MRKVRLLILAISLLSAGSEACQSLVVKPAGYLGGAFAGPSNTLQVDGPVTNEGTRSCGSRGISLRGLMFIAWRPGV